MSRWEPAKDAWTPVEPQRIAPMLAASSDGAVIVAGGGWGGSSTPLFITDHGFTHQLDGSAARSAIGVSADGTRAFAATDGEVTGWEAPDWVVRARIPTDALIVGAAMSRDGGAIALTEGDGDLREWRLPPRGGRRPLDGLGTVWDVRATADGKLLASGGNDGVFRVWDAGTGDLVREVALDPGGLGFMTIDGRDAIIAGNTVGLVRIGLDDLTIRWKRPLDGVANDIERRKDDTLLIAYTTGDVERLRADGTSLWRVHVADWDVVAAPAPNGDVVASAQGAIVRLDAEDGHVLSSSPHKEISDVVVPAPDGGVYIGEVGKMTLFDRDAKLVREMSGMYEAPTSALEVKDGVIASGDDSGNLCIWSADGKPMACWEAHGGAVWRASFLPAGDRIATGGSEGAVRVRDLATMNAPVAELLAAARRRFGLAPGDGHVVASVGPGVRARRGDRVPGGAPWTGVAGGVRPRAHVGTEGVGAPARPAALGVSARPGRAPVKERLSRSPDRLPWRPECDYEMGRIAARLLRGHR